MFKPGRLGKVTFVDTSEVTSKGAFIEDLSEKMNIVSDSPTSKVFVPSRLLKDLNLKEGQLVEFEEENNVATAIKPLAA